MADKNKKNIEAKLIPYEHTLYDLLIDNLKGKYFQSLNSNVVVHIPEKSSIYHVEHGKLSVWYPFLGEWGDLSLEDFHNFALISEKQFEEYKKKQEDIFAYLLVHKNSQAYKEYLENQGNNEANLSAKE